MCEDKIPLSKIQEGESAVVRELTSTGSMRRRLLDIGLVEGTNIECLQKSPAGDPVAYLRSSARPAAARGAVIALRAEDSAAVLVG